MNWKAEPSSWLRGLWDVWDEEGNRIAKHVTRDVALLVAAAPDLRAELALIVEGWDAIESNKIRNLSDWELERRGFARAAHAATEVKDA